MGDLRIRPPYQCPVCRAEEYKQIEVPDRYGQPKKTQAYQCRGCSIVFKNPDRFTMHRHMAVSTEELYRLSGRNNE